MSLDFHFVPDLTDLDIPTDGILSRTVYDGERARAVLFAFSAGEELSEHTASMPAVLHLLQGEAYLTLGEEAFEARAGAWAHMDAHLPHSIRAKTPLVMLLLMLK